MKNNIADFKAWCEGKTGFPFVDACMREMKETGFMPNRGRMTTASFLIYTINIDWRWGAEFFEHNLIDHHVGSNYVNWQMASGIGWNPMSIVFNAVRQSFKYEPDPLFIKKWIPELENCPDRLVHTPWDWPKLRNQKNVDCYLTPIRPRNHFLYTKVKVTPAIENQVTKWEKGPKAETVFEKRSDLLNMNVISPVDVKDPPVKTTHKSKWKKQPKIEQFFENISHNLSKSMKRNLDISDNDFPSLSQKVKK